MNCPKCGGVVSFQNRQCEKCGEDLAQYRRVCALSNRYYNEGLSKAKVRDLSGAVIDLKNSLQLNKRNIQARNLLGLIYNEMGETVLALGEWVISKNYQEEDNLADEYMNIIQNNPSKLHNTNQTIKKYNYALSQAKAGNYDVALLQLKKVVAVQPKYLAAQQMLALLYIRQGDQDKAVKILRKTQKIDINNTRTLHYLASLGVNPSSRKNNKEMDRKIQNKPKKLEKADDPKFFSSELEIRDGKINRWYFIYLLIGVVVGMLVGFFLILPTRDRAMAEKYNREAVVMAEQQADLFSEIQTLEDDKDDLNLQIENLEKELQKVKDEAVNEAAYNKFFKAVTAYINNDKSTAAQTLIEVEINKFESAAAKDLYDVIAEETFPALSKTTYTEGYKQYYNHGYEQAIETFLLALKYDDTNVDAMYYLARCYEMTGKIEKAKKYYKEIITKYTGNYRVSEATRRLDAITASE